MNCRKVNNLLSAYMDGELPGVECLQIRDHINRCASCSDDYDQLLHMKRLLGKMKVQVPVHEALPERIFQTIRVDAQLAAERSISARLNDLATSVRLIVFSPRTLAAGLTTIGAVMALASIHNNDQVHVVGNWDHSTPPASEFTASIKYPDPQRFVSTPSRNAPGIRMINEVSFSDQMYPYPPSLRQGNRNRLGTVDYTIVGR